MRDLVLVAKRLKKGVSGKTSGRKLLLASSPVEKRELRIIPNMSFCECVRAGLLEWASRSVLPSRIKPKRNILSNIHTDSELKYYRGHDIRSFSLDDTHTPLQKQLSSVQLLKCL